MSIPIKDFVEGNFEESKFKEIDHPVLVCLKKNRLAFSVREIVEKTKMKMNTVRSMLTVLKKKGKVVHKTPYFAYKEYCKK